MRLIFAIGLWATLASWGLAADTAASQAFPTPINTQKPGEHPPTPQEAAAGFRVPEGFQVTLFAGEPDIRQPICMAFDDRGRLWVAECYSYAGGGFDHEQRDRIVILHDTDGDGQFDKRKVYWDQGSCLTSIAIGFGGVWMLDEGKLKFMPEANGDDIPDGPAEVLLDGFDLRDVEHNVVNGLMWGPDGWLYGRHGIQASSFVGSPGTARESRTQINCSIWRYHPTRRHFEVIAQGTTNPWGFDYNDIGEMFFTNNVIGHLWHVVPGSHYKRMYGSDMNPHLYELMSQTADHYHWDHGQTWQDSRDISGVHGQLGGGHSHCGGMIYLGDNWPEKYRGNMFMCNTHGRRINQDSLDYDGHRYVGRHGEDFAFAGTEWFRGVQLIYGPDGGVYLSDWSDLGECHDSDGVHRTSGRIYKIVYKSPRPVSPTLDIQALSNAELVHYQLHRNDWYVRKARRVLQERAARGIDMADAKHDLEEILDHHPQIERKLRAVWALHAIGEIDAFRMMWLLTHDNEFMRVWGVRLFHEQKTNLPRVYATLKRKAARDGSGLVQLHLAGALSRMSQGTALEVAKRIAAREQGAANPNLPLLLWYGIEPIVAEDPISALPIIETSQMPVLRRLAARRVFSQLDSKPLATDLLLSKMRDWDVSAQQTALLGLQDALRGRRKVAMPLEWAETADRLKAKASPEVAALIDELAVVFGDGRGIEDLLSLAKDEDAPDEQRAAALITLAENQVPQLEELLFKLLKDRAFEGPAARALSYYNHPETPGKLLDRWRQMKHAGRRETINTLCSRADYAIPLLEAVAAGEIGKFYVTPYHARQMQLLGDDQVASRLENVWGSFRETSAEKEAHIVRLKIQLKEYRSVDISNGKELFVAKCAACHRLYGEGGETGPDLTGSNRDNLDYLLNNIVDPSAVVPQSYRMSVIETHNGQVVSGVITRETEQVVTVQTQEREVTLDRGDIAAIDPTELSLMPDGLLDDLQPEEVVTLIRYLQTLGR